MGKQQFWGIIEGSGKAQSRGGSKASGMTVEVAGWKGRVRVHVWYNEGKGRDEFRVMLYPHWDSADGASKEIASGILDHRALKDPFIPALIA